jgi:hypothetical protein
MMVAVLVEAGLSTLALEMRELAQQVMLALARELQHTVKVVTCCSMLGAAAADKEET